jgi:hypothetical protein
LIKIKEDLLGKVKLSSSIKEEDQEETEYPITIKSKTIRHSLFVLRKV